MELRFYQQLHQKHVVLEKSLVSQKEELTILKRNLHDNQHYPHLAEKLNNLQVRIHHSTIQGVCIFILLLSRSLSLFVALSLNSECV